MVIKILLIMENKKEQKQIMEKVLEKSNQYQFFMAETKEEVLKILKSTEIDLLLADYFINDLDVLYLLSTINDNQDTLFKPSHIGLISEYVNENMSRRLERLNVDIIFVRPINVLNITAYIINLPMYEEEAIERSDIDLKIVRLLHELGVPSHVRGYYFLKEAIRIIFYDNKMIGKMTKVVYPRIALDQSSTPQRVERSIRHAILISMKRGNQELMKEIFAFTIDNSKNKPTNTEYISMVGEYLKLTLIKDKEVKIY